MQSASAPSGQPEAAVGKINETSAAAAANRGQRTLSDSVVLCRRAAAIKISGMEIPRSSAALNRSQKYMYQSILTRNRELAPSSHLHRVTARQRQILGRLNVLFHAGNRGRNVLDIGLENHAACVIKER